ncbi:MAG: hybrid sensor histidine kinase/response regulator [Pseudomonas kuykendallii]|uniref:histidine kinase n=2 Tax=Pseudomonas kuykendallii TaxID=1007099 RepID=A0A2W5ESQ5_9PSED|nr:MAG: hybrid sensor histidine kinase/response regulator [Pseudomonas kuykendallii]
MPSPFLSHSHGCQGWRGEMSERIRAFDWSTTELGPLEGWSHSLCNAVQFLLGSPVPLVMLWGRPGYMIYNDAYSVFAGGRHPYLLGSPVELGWPEVAEFNRNVMDTCLAGGTLSYRDKELVLLRHGKPEEVWMDLYYSPVPGDDGAPAGVMAIVVETTERMVSERRRQEAESAYREANERLHLALSSGAVSGLFVWDLETNLLSGDARFARTFLLPVEQVEQGLPNDRAMQMIHPEDLDHLNRQVEQTIALRVPFKAEYRIRQPDGSYLWVLASGRCEFGEQGQPLRFPGVLIDIHERKIAEDELLQLTHQLEQRVEAEVQARSEVEERLRQSQKLEAIGGLTGGVAHDFNNMLQVIAGNLHLLARLEPSNERAQRYVQVALCAVDRGAKLSSQLLSFARRQQLQPTQCDPLRIYQGLGELFQRALGETIHLDVQLPRDSWPIYVDRNQLENALLNLAINARDAMQGEGTIRITGENVTLDEAFCAGKQIEPGDYVCLSVCDNGIGMTQEVLEHAFEPFFTTKPEGHSTGLGLSMVFGFVKQSGGHTEIISEHGVGSTVQMYFPRSARNVPDEEPQASDECSACGGETILVVEDDAGVRATAVELLQQLGYRVLTAANGELAQQLLDEGTRVDLIFTDVVMPGRIKSSDLADWARRQTPPVPLLFTSGFTRDVISRNQQLSADTHLLSKPYTPQALESMLRSVLAGRGAG